MNTPYITSLGIVASVCVLVGSGLIFSYSVNAQQNTAKPILQCFHEGTAVVSAPQVDDFSMKQTGMFVEALQIKMAWRCTNCACINSELRCWFCGKMNEGENEICH